VKQINIELTTFRGFLEVLTDGPDGPAWTRVNNLEEFVKAISDPNAIGFSTESGD